MQFPNTNCTDLSYKGETELLCCKYSYRIVEAKCYLELVH